MDKEYGKVDLIFYQGIDNNGISVANDMITRANMAYQMAEIAKKYGATNSDKINESIDASNNLLTSTTIDEKFKANTRITNAVAALEISVDTSYMKEQDRKIWLDAINELSSKNRTIKNDRYNEAASNYNSKLKEFPASVMKVLGLIKTLPTYTGGE